MRKRTIVLRPPGADYEIRVLGSRRTPLHDFYHALLRLSWPATIALLTLGHLAINALFGLAYFWVGGISNAREGSLLDAFFFSVQTMGTIGYGVLSPQTTGANWLVVLESVVGLVVTALSTGLVFAKLSRPTARIVFSKKAVICPMNGVPTLMFRVSNERGNSIVNAQISAVLSRTEKTLEGELFYRSQDVALVRDRALSLNRSFSVSHRLTDTSPFLGQSAESITAQEYELSVMIVGIDDTAMQTVYANHTYFARDILWDMRLVDVLSELADGTVVLDLEKFHETEPLPGAR